MTTSADFSEDSDESTNDFTDQSGHPSMHKASIDAPWYPHRTPDWKAWPATTAPWPAGLRRIISLHLPARYQALPPVPHPEGEEGANHVGNALGIWRKASDRSDRARPDGTFSLRSSGDMGFGTAVFMPAAVVLEESQYRVRTRDARIWHVASTAISWKGRTEFLVAAYLPLSPILCVTAMSDSENPALEAETISILASVHVGPESAG